jgi:hypothetical protein
MILTPTEVKIGIRKKSLQGGSNSRSTAYEAVALPLGHTGNVLSFRCQAKNGQEEYSGRGLNSRPSACKADVITTRLPEHYQVEKECYTLGGT